MAEIKHDRDFVYVEVRGHESLQRIEDVLLDFCDQHFGKAPYTPVMLPVMLNNGITRPARIGYARIDYDAEETIYTINHYTLDQKEIATEWNLSDFYKGAYGLMPEQGQSTEKE